MASGCLSAKTQIVASKVLHTRFTQKKFKLEFFIGSLAIHLTCLSIEAFIAGLRWSRPQEWGQEGEGSCHRIEEENEVARVNFEPKSDQGQDEKQNLQAQPQRPACIGEVQACGVFGNDESEDESDN